MQAGPARAALLYGEAISHLKAGRHGAAADSLNEVVSARPDWAEAHYALCLSYAACRRAVWLNPRFAAAQQALGLLYVALRRRDDAPAQYKILKALDAALANQLFRAVHSDKIVDLTRR